MDGWLRGFYVAVSEGVCVCVCVCVLLGSVRGWEDTVVRDGQ